MKFAKFLPVPSRVTNPPRLPRFVSVLKVKVLNPRQTGTVGHATAFPPLISESFLAVGISHSSVTDIHHSATECFWPRLLPTISAPHLNMPSMNNFPSARLIHFLFFFKSYLSLVVTNC